MADVKYRVLKSPIAAAELLARLTGPIVAFLRALLLWARDVTEIVNSLREGKINSTNNVTLTADAATTVVTDFNVGPNSVIVFMPTTLNAAAELTVLRVSSRGGNTFTITHANAASTDRTFGYAVLG